jgi:hypothetical protein
VSATASPATRINGPVGPSPADSDGGFTALRSGQLPCLGLVQVAGPVGGICTADNDQVAAFTCLRLLALSPDESVRMLWKLARTAKSPRGQDPAPIAVWCLGSRPRGQNAHGRRQRLVSPPPGQSALRRPCAKGSAPEHSSRGAPPDHLLLRWRCSSCLPENGGVTVR